MFFSKTDYIHRFWILRITGKSLSLLFAFLPLLWLLAGCSSPSFYRNFSCQLSRVNALRLEVSCQTDQEADVYMEYWNTKGGRHLFSELSQRSREHHFELINLLPQSRYRLKIHARMGDRTYEDDAGIFSTDSLPGNLPSFTMLNNQFRFDGYIMLKTFIDSGAYLLINDRAQIVWYESYSGIQLRPFEWEDDRHIVSLKDANTVLEFDLHSHLYYQTEMTEKGKRITAHHEIIKNDRGDYVFLTKEMKRLDLCSFGGIKNDSIVGDGIMIVNPGGEILWHWSIFDHIDPETTHDFFEFKSDWGHGNSVAYSRDGHFLVSFRDFSQIWKIDRNNGKVLWRFGKGGDFKPDTSDEFLRQHTAHINRFGDLMLFDNGTVRRGYSAVRSFKIDEKNKKCRPVISFRLPREFFTARMGSAYLMDDSHVLVCSPMKYVLLGVFDDKGNELWKAKGSMPSYRALYIEPGKLENPKPF